MREGVKTMTKTFAIFLKTIREAKNLSLRDVEKITGISNSYISQLERDTTKNPTIPVIKKLADAYDYPFNKMADLVVGDTEYQFKATPRSTTADLESCPPDIQYMLRQYQNLSDEGKKQLVDYIDFLLKKEKGKRNTFKGQVITVKNILPNQKEKKIYKKRILGDFGCVMSNTEDKESAKKKKAG